MRVVFIASGNKKVGQVNSFVRSQYDSLAEAGQEMMLYPIVGHGIKGYMHHLKSLRRLIKTEQPDIVHAHYSTCGLLASLSTFGIRYKNGKKPKVFVSLLGSFPRHNRKYRIVRFFLKHVWDGALVKSERTRSQLALPLPVVPNGVNTDIFRPLDQQQTRQQLGFEADKHYIVWCSSPAREEKNWPLAQKSVELLNIKRKERGEQPVVLTAVYDHTPQEVATYMNAADCLLLTSDTEGSPNVIKEAMACCCPIVTTNVGDVSERLKNLDGCYIIEDNDIRFTDTDAAAVITARCLEQALAFGKRTDGYQRIADDGLDIKTVAQKIISIYHNLC